MNLLTKQIYTFGNSIYLLSDLGIWDEAQAEARRLQGNLVTINNAQEQSFLTGLFSGSQERWIGYNDRQIEGQFRWISRENSIYEKWAANEPDNDTTENEVILDIFGNWFGVRNDRDRQGIIEITNPSTPIFVIEDLGMIEPSSGTKRVLFNVRRYGNVNTNATINYSTQNNSARAGIDYQAVSGQLRFRAGERNKSIAVNILKDNDGITREQFFLNLTSISGDGLLGDNQAVGTIRETSDIVTFGGKTYLLTDSLNWGEAQVEAATYGGNLATINNQREQSFLTGVFSGDQERWIGYTDAGGEGQFQWISGQNSIYTKWTTNEPDNDVSENVVTLDRFGNWFGVRNNANRQGIIEIPNQEPLPLTNLTSESIYTFGNSIYLLTPQATNWGEAQVQAQNYQGNLVTINSPQEQTFLTGLFSGDQERWIGYTDAGEEQQFRWISRQNSNYTKWASSEPDIDISENVVTLDTFGNWLGVRNNANRFGVVEITNPDTPIFVIEDLGIIEPSSGSKRVLFNVRRYGNSNRAVTINYSSQNNTARAGIDYQAVSGQLRFNAGENLKTITVNILKDNDNITREQFFLNLTSIIGNGVLGDNQAVGTIRETNDVVSFAGKSYLLTDTVNWGEAQVEATTYGGNLVTINNQNEQSFLANAYSGQNSWIGYSDAGGEGDFRWITDPTAYTNWDTNEPDNNVTENVVILDSNGDWLDVRNNTNRQGIVEIQRGLPSLSINNVNIVEGNSGRKNAIFTVTRSGQAAQTLTVNYTTINNTATAGSDFIAQNGTLTFDTNERTKRIRIQIQGDQIQERNETFFVNLSNPVNATISDNLGRGTILNNDFIGTARNDLLVGSPFGDILSGKAGNDILNGNGGNDLLNGGAGNDRMRGGNGNDSYVVDSLGDLVNELLNQGRDLVRSSVNFTLPNNVENLTLFGNGNRQGTGNNLANRIVGNNGNNSLLGQDGNDTIVGNGGNDILNGGRGRDRMQGGIGNDSYTVDNLGDRVIELLNQGQDTVRSSINFTLPNNVENLNLLGNGNRQGTGNNLANRIIGNNGNNSLFGQTGNDTLTGNGGNDILNGGTGSDRLQGGNGNDSYNVDSRGDQVIELSNQGRDTVNSSVNYTLPNNVESLTLLGNRNNQGTGNNLANNIVGNNGNNVLTGRTGNDRLVGLRGSDTLIGGVGRDTLIGGVGADFFRFNSRSEGVDTITDYSVVADTILIRGNGFGGGLTPGVLRVNQFTSGLSATDAQDRFIYNRGTGALFFDRDGNGSIAQVQIASLSSGLALDNTEFIVV